MPITRIQVRNVKGIHDKTFSHTIIPNKPSMLVAGNGFGKSSIATAFKSLNANRLNLGSDDYYQNNQANSPELSIEYTQANGVPVSLNATSNNNSIFDEFDCFVINNQVRAKGVRIPTQGGGHNVSASLHIDEIILVNTIPPAEDFDYSINDEKTAFGTNGKVLTNIIEKFNSHAFIKVIMDSYGLFDQLQRVKDTAAVTTAKIHLNAQVGTAPEIKVWASANLQPTLEQLVPLRTIVDKLAPLFPGIVRMDLFLTAMQLERLYRADKVKFKAAARRRLYEFERSGYLKAFNAFNATWRDIRPRERDNRLIVEFPKAHYISNGQRDVLCFVALLEQARRKLTKQKAILVIDEVFDYLDDANLIVAQYYVSEFIEDFKTNGREIYPLILTHLDPRYFKNFAFSNMKIYYLDHRTVTPNPNLRTLIIARDNKAIDQGVRDDIAKYLMHFHIVQINRRADFQQLNLLPQWGEANHFDTFVDGHIQNYLNNQAGADPFAVCCAVRKRVERNIYNQIPAGPAQTFFLETHTTNEKLEYAESIGVTVPEFYYLLGIIYNDGLHWKNHIDNESPIIVKLANPTIKHLISKVFA